ncbi:hypothetical protein YC2023_094463 [Brassica napus]
MPKGGKTGMGHKITFLRPVFIKHGVDFPKILWYNLNDIVIGKDLKKMSLHKNRRVLHQHLIVLIIIQINGRAKYPKQFFSASINSTAIKSKATAKSLQIFFYSKIFKATAITNQTLNCTKHSVLQYVKKVTHCVSQLYHQVTLYAKLILSNVAAHGSPPPLICTDQKHLVVNKVSGLISPPIFSMGPTQDRLNYFFGSYSTASHAQSNIENTTNLKSPSCLNERHLFQISLSTIHTIIYTVVGVSPCLLCSMPFVVSLIPKRVYRKLENVSGEECGEKVQTVVVDKLHYLCLEYCEAPTNKVFEQLRP